MKLYYELTLVEEELLHDNSAWQSDGLLHSSYNAA
jgi:hypothetical protein